MRDHGAEWTCARTASTSAWSYWPSRENWKLLTVMLCSPATRFLAWAWSLSLSERKRPARRSMAPSSVTSTVSSALAASLSRFAGILRSCASKGVRAAARMKVVIFMMSPEQRSNWLHQLGTRGRLGGMHFLRALDAGEARATGNAKLAIRSEERRVG